MDPQRMISPLVFGFKCCVEVQLSENIICVKNVYTLDDSSKKYTNPITA